jgi:predicted RNase H-like nuclease (RuvC/YqgF family)
MLDRSKRGFNDLEVIIHRLKNHVSILERLILEQHKEIKQLKYKLKEQIKSNN